ncbi:MAG TPA: hypothetical protein VIS71_01185, partial [Terrimicrobium sp.]
ESCPYGALARLHGFKLRAQSAPAWSERTVGCKVVEITEALPVIVASGEGEKLSAFGEEVIFHLGGVQTGDKIALWIHFVSP